MRVYMSYKIHYGLVALDGLDKMTSIKRTSRHLNSLSYKVLGSRIDYQYVFILPKND
jgi:hypothetical protein